MIDGPGQGETRIFNKAYMPVDIENAFNAVIDFIYQDKCVGRNIGLIGYSFGGYLAARTASVSKKLKACCIIGGSYEPKEIMNFLPNFVNVFMALTGRPETEVRVMLGQMNLREMAKNISCPLYIIHGKPDPIFSVEGVKRIYNEASSNDKMLKEWEDGNHCVTNHATEVTTSVVDWFAEKLHVK